jgi:hypothetical protein
MPNPHFTSARGALREGHSSPPGGPFHSVKSLSRTVNKVSEDRRGIKPLVSSTGAEPPSRVGHHPRPRVTRSLNPDTVESFSLTPLHFGDQGGDPGPRPVDSRITSSTGSTAWARSRRRRGRPEPIARLGIDSGLQFLQLALDQALGVLRIGWAKGSQSDGGTTLWDDHEISPHQRVAFHRDVVDIRKRNRNRSSSSDSRLTSDGGFCWISSLELDW